MWHVVHACWRERVEEGRDDAKQGSHPSTQRFHLESLEVLMFRMDSLRECKEFKAKRHPRDATIEVQTISLQFQDHYSNGICCDWDVLTGRGADPQPQLQVP